MTIAQTTDELFSHLREQLYFLQASARSYDQGIEGEAKRLAVVLRILLHDRGRNSHSLLGSIGVKETLLFHDVVGPVPADAFVFVGLWMRPTTNGYRYCPSL
jgi:hypothetical protein